MEGGCGACCAGRSAARGGDSAGGRGTSWEGSVRGGLGVSTGGTLSSMKRALGVPHSMQNLSSGEGWFPQLGQSIRRRTEDDD